MVLLIDRFFIPIIISVINYRYIESFVYLSALAVHIIKYSYQKPFGEYVIETNRFYILLDFIGSEIRFVMSSYIIFEQTIYAINSYIYEYDIIYNYLLRFLLISFCYLCGYSILILNNKISKLSYGSQQWRNINLLTGIIDLIGSITLLSISN